MHLRGKVLADIYDDERGRRGEEKRREWNGRNGSVGVGDGEGVLG